MSFRDSTAAVAVLATAAAVLAVAAGFVLIQLYIVPVHRLQPAITRLFGLTCAAVAEQRPVAKAHTPFSYIIYQSADAAYAPLLEATGIVHRAYAERHGATLHVRHGPEPGLRACRAKRRCCVPAGNSMAQPNRCPRSRGGGAQPRLVRLRRRRCHNRETHGVDGRGHNYAECVAVCAAPLWHITRGWRVGEEFSRPARRECRGVFC